MILLLIAPSVFATTETMRADDQWEANEGTLTDGKLWINDNIDVYTDSISAQGDMVCYDWDNNGQYDNCYWDNVGCGGGGCNANSCDSFSIPLNMNDAWKTNCNLETACQEGVDVPERICDADVDPNCAWDTSTKQEKIIAAKVYYDCDNSLGQMAEVTVSPTFTWTVVDTHKYDCNDCSGCYNYNNKDYMGKYGTTSWRAVSSDISCSTNKKCSEYFDDQESTTKTYTGFANPCKWDNGQSCSLDSDCASNECVHGTCRATDPYCSDNYCDAGETYSSCPQDCCDNDCTGYTDTICRSVCDGYNTCSFYSSSTKSACNSVYLNDEACVDANTYVTCCESTPADCASNQYCSGGVCFACSTTCDGSCQSSACYGTDLDCDSNGNPTLICCGNSYCESGETYSSCPQDCCEADCTGYGSPPENPDTVCHSLCNGYNSCSFTTGCDGYNSSTNICLNSTAYANCCSGTPTNCQPGQTCSNGVCFGADLAILDVIPIQVIPNVDIVKGKSGYVRVIIKNLGNLNATGKVNVTFEGTPLVPYNPTSASKLIIAGTNESFDFIFKPEIVGNNMIISANVSVIG